MNYGPQVALRSDPQSLYLNNGATLAMQWESSATDPRASGLDRPIGSIVFNPSSLAVYRKTSNVATTDWSQINSFKKLVSSDSTQVTIASGLSGESDYGYTIIGHIVNNAAGTSVYRLLPNALTTNQICVGTLNNATLGTLNSQGGAILGLAKCEAAAPTSFVANIWGRHNGMVRFCDSLSGYYSPTTGAGEMISYRFFGRWNQSSTEITSFDILSDQANGIGATSEFMVFPWR